MGFFDDLKEFFKGSRTKYHKASPRLIQIAKDVSRVYEDNGQHLANKNRLLDVMNAFKDAYEICSMKVPETDYTRNLISSSVLEGRNEEVSVSVLNRIELTKDFIKSHNVTCFNAHQYSQNLVACLQYEIFTDDVDAKLQNYLTSLQSIQRGSY